MTVAERDAFNKARIYTNSRLEASLAAAWVKDQQPAAGLEGSSCAATQDAEDSLVEGAITAITGVNV